MSKIVITLVGILLIIVALLVVYNEKASLNKFTLNPSSSPSLATTPTTQYKDLLIINKNFKNKSGGMDNYFLVTEKGDIVKQLVPPPSQLGRAGTGRISPNFEYFVYNSWDSPPPPPGCGNPGKLACPTGKYGLIFKDLNSKEEHYIYTPDGDGTSYPYISSDSAKIAYSNNTSTFIYDVMAQSSEKIADFSSQDMITWFSDSKKLLISDGVANYIYNLQTKLLAKVSVSREPSILPSRFASVSSDGKFIIALEPDGYYLMNADGSNPQKIDMALASYYFFGFLNGGHQAIFSSYTPTNVGQQNILSTDKSTVFLYDTDTGIIKPIITGANLQFFLSPDGKHLAFLDTFRDNKNYQLLDINTGKSTFFLEAQDNPDPASDNIVTIIDWK